MTHIIASSKCMRGMECLSSEFAASMAPLRGEGGSFILCLVDEAEVWSA